MKRAMEKVRRFTEGLTFEQFLEDEKGMDAVLRNLEVIGEAARGIPDDLKTQHTEVEWARMVGLRNIITHEYFGVDMRIIWQIATSNLPATESLIADMLARFEGSK
jgi:hypothetical protein